MVEKKKKFHEKKQGKNIESMTKTGKSAWVELLKKGPEEKCKKRKPPKT